MGSLKKEEGLLTSLSIKNYAIVDEVSLELKEGLNILTGETGAGKSVLINALLLSLGEDYSEDMLRTGADKLVIEAIFEVEKNSISYKRLKMFDLPIEEESLILSREIQRDGKTKIRVNGRVIPLSSLKIISESLLDIHGQHETQSLFKEERQLDLLDRFGGSELLSLREKVEKLFYKLSNLEKEKNSLLIDEKEKTRRVEFLTFEIEEIERAKLEVTEDESLEKERLILANAQKLLDTLTEITYLLKGGEENLGALDLLKKGFKNLSEIAIFDKENLDPILKEFEALTSHTGDLLYSLEGYKQRIEANPRRLSEVEDRLDQIKRLKKKYGNSITEVLSFKKRAEEELKGITHQEERIEELKREIERIKDELRVLCIELNKKRKEVAISFKKEIEKELKNLAMDKAIFEVVFSVSEDKNGITLEIDHKKLCLFPWGIDSIEFMISTNPGEEIKPLIKIASGGELSRIMLALKTVLAQLDEVPTLVFDEIDQGIGGKVGEMIGRKLKNIGKVRQVICITHLSQIASFADHHYFISKKIKNGRTNLEVKELKEKEKVLEVARMLAGTEITTLAIKHAEEMIKNAEKVITDEV